MKKKKGGGGFLFLLFFYVLDYGKGLSEIGNVNNGLESKIYFLQHCKTLRFPA